MLIETKPIEIIYNEDRVNEEVLSMLKTCYFNPLLNKLNKPDAWNSAFATNELDRLFKS